MPLTNPFVALQNRANTYTTGAQDFTAASSLIVPASGGYAPTADASLGYDTTQDAWAAGGAGAINGKFPRVVSLAQDTTDTLSAATITTNETAWTKKFSIPANFLIANKALRISALFLYTSSGSAPTIQLRLRAGGLGGTVIWSNLASAWGNSASNFTKGWQWVLVGAAAPSGSSNTLTCELATDPAVNLTGRTAQPVAWATNAAQDLVITLQYSAGTAGNSITMLSLIVEELN